MSCLADSATCGTCFLWQAAELTGIELSESLSMMPASSVSALVFAHPDSEYFAVGTIAKDQVNTTVTEEAGGWLG